MPDIAISDGGRTENETDRHDDAIMPEMPAASKFHNHNSRPSTYVRLIAPFHMLPEVRSELASNASQLSFISSIKSVGQKLASHLRSNRRRRTRNQILGFLTHKSTVLCLTLLVVGISVALMTISIIRAQQESSHAKESLDSNFYSIFSQAMLSLLTIYLTILPPVRNRSLNLRYRSWLWLCLLFSAIASIISLVVYISQPSVSLIFVYGAGFAQVVSTLLLVECVEKAVNAGVIGGWRWIEDSTCKNENYV